MNHTSPAALLADLMAHQATFLQGRPLLLAPQAAGPLALDQHTWYLLYTRLAQGIPNGALPAPAELAARIGRYQQAGLLPVVLCQAEYVVLRSDHLRTLQQGTATPASLPAEAFEAHAGTFLTVFFPNEFEYFHPTTPGLGCGATQVVWPHDLCLATGSQPLPSALTLDLGTGQGPQQLTLDAPLAVHYATPGQRRVQWHPEPGAAPRGFAIEVQNAVPAYDQYLQLTSSYPYQNVTATGHAWVFYGAGNTELTNPLIFSEGFPGNYSLNYLYNSLNAQNLLTDCLAQGLDIVLLGYSDGTTYIEANAGVVIACIQELASQMTNSSSIELRVGGACMGGVVTRYALAYMETNQLPHYTKLYFSVDSPHQGLNVPASLLYLMSALSGILAYLPASVAGPLQAAYDKLTTFAGRELMLFTVDNPDASPSTPDYLRMSLGSNFDAIGQFPQQPYLIGSSNGVNTGQGTPTPAGATVLSASLGDYFVSIYATPGNSSDIDYSNLLLNILYVDNYCWTNCPASFDSVPGSTEEFFGLLATALGTTTAYPLNSFVPTLSSLAIRTINNQNASLYADTDLFTDLSTTPYTSWLATTFSDAQNNPHMHVSPALAAFYLKKFVQSLP